jgi:hypothetical protein
VEEWVVIKLTSTVEIAELAERSKSYAERAKAECRLCTTC